MSSRWVGSHMCVVSTPECEHNQQTGKCKAVSSIFAAQAYSLTEPANFFGTDMSDALEALLPLRQQLATGS